MKLEITTIYFFKDLYYNTIMVIHKLIKDNYLHVPKSVIDSERLKEETTILNPEWISYSNFPAAKGSIPPKKYLRFYREDSDNFILPREFPISKILKTSEDLTLEDKTFAGNDIKLISKIKLKEEQVPAVETMVNSKGGVLSFPCGCGKTIMALEAISRLKKRTIILVHTNVLMKQWKDRIKQFLGLKENQIGIIGDGEIDYKDKTITIGMVQSLLFSASVPDEVFKYFGIVVADEVHRHGGSEWSKVVHKFNASIKFGLTATPHRSDGLEKIIFWAIGDIIYQGDNHALTPKFIPINTNTFFDTSNMTFWGTNKISLVKIISKLTKDKERNKLIIDELIKYSNEDRKILLLSDRVKHLKDLITWFNNLKNKKVKTSLFIGEMKEDQRKKAMKADVLFATQHIAKEGLDIPELDTLFVVTPFANENRAKQSVGRILRKRPDKKQPIVIDFVDRNIDILRFMWVKRKKAYDSLLESNQMPLFK